MTEWEIKQLARRLLNQLLSDPANAGTFRAVMTDLTLDGEAVPLYAGDGPAGGFECFFWPLAGAEEIVRRCARAFDTFELSEGGRKYRLPDLPGWASERDAAIETMAEQGIFRMLLNLRDRLTAAFDLNLEESELVSQAMLGEVLTEWGERAGVRIKVNAGPSIKVLADKVAADVKRHARWILEVHQRVRVEGQRGPKSITDAHVADALRALGAVSKAKIAAHLGREETAVKRWLAASKWRTWDEARRALLAGVRPGRIKKK